MKNNILGILLILFIASCNKESNQNEPVKANEPAAVATEQKLKMKVLTLFIRTSMIKKSSYQIIKANMLLLIFGQPGVNPVARRFLILFALKKPTKIK